MLYYYYNIKKLFGSGSILFYKFLLIFNYFLFIVIVDYHFPFIGFHHFLVNIFLYQSFVLPKFLGFL